MIAASQQLRPQPPRAPSNRCPCMMLQVARGYRRPCPQNWPPELAQLIMDCWAQDCDLRPPAAQARAVGSLWRAPGAHVIIDDSPLAAAAPAQPPVQAAAFGCAQRSGITGRGGTAPRSRA